MNQISDGQLYLWNLEFDSIRAKIRGALENIDSISKRNYVRGELEAAISRLDDLCDMIEVNDV